ncbi:MAG: NPCBM/NEW2 domain-containing protein [Clostridium sp.]
MKKAISTLAIVAMVSSTIPTPALAAILNSKEGVSSSSRQETISEIKSQIFDVYNNPNYQEYSTKFEVKPTSYVNNGGQYSTSALNNAFDNNLSTHWETGKANTSTFKNTVTVDFDKVESINRLVYAVRQDNGYKGYPKQIKIYSSLTNSGEDFKLVAQGSSVTKKSLMEFRFKSTDFKRLRIEFVDADSSWASAAEIKLFKEDLLSDEINRMFVDKTYSSLNQEFNSMDKINQMEQAIVNHPLKAELTKQIEIAKKILRNELELEGRVITPTRVGNIKSHSSKNLKFGLGMNLQSTGIYSIPGEVVTLYVEGNGNGPLPQVFFSQNEGSWKNWGKTFNLKPGINEIVTPDIPYGQDYPTNPKKGGAIYIVNPYTEKDQVVAPKIRIDGGNKFPLFNEGEDPVSFRQELTNYKAKLDEDKAAGGNKVLDLVEVNSDRMMIAGTATGAYEAYVTKGINPNETAKFWDDTLEKLFEIYKLDKSSLIHDPKFTKEQIRFMQPVGAMYASSDHIGVQKNMMVNIHNPESIKKGSWGIAHELGHRMDVPAREWTEVTNNVVSLIMSYEFGNPNDRVQYESGVYPYVAPDTRSKTYEEVGLFDRLGMFWQLQVYDNSYWSKLNALYRERYPSIANEQHKRDVLIEYSSEVMNLNLGEYFKRHGFEASQATLDKISKYPKPTKKLWYLRGEALQYTGTGFTSSAKPEIGGVTTNIQNKTNTLSLKINNEDVNNILGYEIYRDGKVIGFTEKNTFVDSNIDSNVNYNYEVKAYDMKLNPSISSSFASHSPSIVAAPNTTLKLRESFNPLSYVKGLSYSGQDLTSGITIKSNNVDTSKQGEYKVVYELSDSGVTTTKSVDITVVSNYAYGSDKNYTVNTSSFGGIKKDLSPSGNKIALLVDGKETNFTKGIGAHANSEITYDLSSEEYDYFTSQIGIDSNVRSSTKASVKYKVIADGKVIYDSKVFTASTESEFIKIPVKGVKNLKLVTDSVDGKNDQDHSVWADAKFITNSSNPKLNIEKSVSTKVGNPIGSIIGSFSAVDDEDGDLTSKVVVEGIDKVNFNQQGNYVIKYKVTDSDNNTTVKERVISVVDMNNFSYLSNLNWLSATIGWNTVKKDKSVENNPIKLTGSRGESVTYLKGIGTHSDSVITYDLTGIDAKYFSSYIGVDREVYNTEGSITFEVEVDGVKKYNSKLMKSNYPQKYVEVDINGAKELKLIVTNGGNGTAFDHASWGDAKIYTVK